MMNPCKDTFAEAQLQIYTLMHRDSYPRFVNSTNYKQLLESAPDASWRQSVMYLIIAANNNQNHKRRSIL